MSGDGKRRKRGAVTVSGAWVPMPLQFLSSRACAGLSPAALKMLVDLCGQLGPNANGNGDLSAAPSVMRAKGWTSNATRQAALDELIAAKLVCMTRQGGRRQCSLYAITLWPMACDFAKLDHGPGAYSVNDWRGLKDEAASRPHRGTAGNVGDATQKHFAMPRHGASKSRGRRLMTPPRGQYRPFRPPGLPRHGPPF